MKILGRMNSMTVMMERFQDAEFSWHCCPQKTVTIPRSVCVLYLLFTQPSLIRSLHSSDPCFSVSCPKGVGYARVYCSNRRFLEDFTIIADPLHRLTAKKYQFHRYEWRRCRFQTLKLNVSSTAVLSYPWNT